MKTAYQKEIEFLTSNTKRNQFIVNLSLSLKGNTILFFRLVERHGVPLFKLLKEKNENKKIYFSSGANDAIERDNIRKEIETVDNAIWVLSAGIGSTGLNIPSIKHIIFPFPMKGKVKILQSIGRGLRLHKNKTKLTVYDLADDLTYNKNKNFSLQHFEHRLDLYKKEGLTTKSYEVNLYE